MNQALAVPTTTDLIPRGALIDDPTRHLIAGWLAEKPSDETKRAYGRDIRRLALWTAGRLHLLAVTRHDLALWADGMRRAGLAESSITRRLSSASSFYTYCVEVGAITASPAEHLKRPKPALNNTTAYLTVEESVAFLAAAKAISPAAHAFAGIMLTTAARISEVTSANVEDLEHTGGHRVLAVTRKGGSRQHLIVAPWVGIALDAHLDGRAAGPLFYRPSGPRIDQPAAWRLVRRIARKADLPNAAKLHPHSLRHTAITAALAKGAHLTDVQDLAGHVDPRTTRRYDQGRHRLDRSPTYLLAAHLSGEK